MTARASRRAGKGARLYLDFERFLKTRKHLNRHHYEAMGGPATVSSMIIWGLARRPAFRKLKFVFPVDMARIQDYPEDREISLIFIRPSRFFAEDSHLRGFIDYQREFNRVWSVKIRFSLREIPSPPCFFRFPWLIEKLEVGGLGIANG